MSAPPVKMTITEKEEQLAVRRETGSLTDMGGNIERSSHQEITMAPQEPKNRINLRWSNFTSSSIANVIKSRIFFF